MGADLIFQYVCWDEKLTPEQVKEEIIKAIKEFKIPELSQDKKVKILNKLENEPSEEYEQFCSFWEDGLFKDFTDSTPTENEKPITEKRAKQIMKGTADEFFDCLNSRDVSWIKHKGEIMYLSGGMSWGDSPTDSYSIIEKFINLPRIILNKAGIS